MFMFIVSCKILYIKKNILCLDQLPVSASVQLTHPPKQLAYSAQNCRLHLRKIYLHTHILKIYPATALFCVSEQHDGDSFPNESTV